MVDCRFSIHLEFVRADVFVTVGREYRFEYRFIHALPAKVVNPRCTRIPYSHEDQHKWKSKSILSSGAIV